MPSNIRDRLLCIFIILIPTRITDALSHRLYTTYTWKEAVNRDGFCAQPLGCFPDPTMTPGNTWLSFSDLLQWSRFSDQGSCPLQAPNWSYTAKQMRCLLKTQLGPEAPVAMVQAESSSAPCSKQGLMKIPEAIQSGILLIYKWRSLIKGSSHLSAQHPWLQKSLNWAEVILWSPAGNDGPEHAQDSEVSCPVHWLHEISVLPTTSFLFPNNFYKALGKGAVT